MSSRGPRVRLLYRVDEPPRPPARFAQSQRCIRGTGQIIFSIAMGQPGHRSPDSWVEAKLGDADHGARWLGISRFHYSDAVYMVHVSDFGFFVRHTHYPIAE